MSATNGIDYDRYRGHLRPHTSEERTKLEASVSAEGVRDPLVVGVLDGKRFLIDGFHRKELADRHGLPLATRSVEFDSEDALLAWMEQNARGRRNQTRTERMYYLGCRYLREKRAQGGTGANQHKQTGQLDQSAMRLAREERVSEKTVRRAGQLSALLNEACACGLSFLKWPVLTERIRYSKKLLERLIELGAGECQETVEALLTENPEKQLSPSAVLRACGDEPEVKEEESAPKPDLLESADRAFEGVLTHAMAGTAADVRKLVAMAEACVQDLRSILKVRDKGKEAV